MKLSIGYMTFPTKAEAKNMVMALIEDELIACANIFDKVESYYWWEKKVQKSTEAVVIFKTRVKNEDKVIKFVRRHHSYDTACVVFTSVDHGNPDFLKWVDQSC